MRKRVEQMDEGELMEKARRTARLDSDRARRYRSRKREAGEMRITMYVPRDAADHVRAAMEQALAEWERGRSTVVPFPSPVRAEPVPALAGSVGEEVFLRIDFASAADVGPIRHVLRDHGFLFIPEQGGWCGRGDVARFSDLVRPCDGRVAIVPPESGMVRSWERYRRS